MNQHFKSRHFESQHFKRLITSLIAAPTLFIFIIYSSEKLFFLFIIAVIQVAVWEYNRLVFGKKGNAWEKGEMFFFSFVIPLTVFLSDFILITAVITCCLLICFLIFLFQIRGTEIDISKMGKVILGFMYMPLLMSYFILLRLLPEGVLWVFFTLTVAFSGDVFAFYIGKTIGKRKLQPFISPGKTVVGTAGLLIGSVAGGILFQKFVFTHLPLAHAVILGSFGGIMGQLGDLFESAIKRAGDAKDAGFIFPGHGGILDRLDSLAFITPFVFYYQHFVMK